MNRHSRSFFLLKTEFYFTVNKFKFRVKFLASFADAFFNFGLPAGKQGLHVGMADGSLANLLPHCKAAGSFRFVVSTIVVFIAPVYVSAAEGAFAKRFFLALVCVYACILYRAAHEVFNAIDEGGGVVVELLFSVCGFRDGDKRRQLVIF
jgi:hypothetical protein